MRQMMCKTIFHITFRSKILCSDFVLFYDMATYKQMFQSFLYVPFNNIFVYQAMVKILCNSGLMHNENHYNFLSLRVYTLLILGLVYYMSVCIHTRVVNWVFIKYYILRTVLPSWIFFLCMYVCYILSVIIKLLYDHALCFRMLYLTFCEI